MELYFCAYFELEPIFSRPCGHHIYGGKMHIWHSYFTDNMQNLFTYTLIDCLIYRKGEKNDAKNATFT